MNSQQNSFFETSRHVQRQTMLLVLLSMLQLAGLQRSFADDANNNAQPAVAKHFSAVVLPILKKHCYECHSHDADAVEGGLVLDSAAGWRIGGDSGPAVVAGEPEKSLLLTAAEYEDTDLQMPPAGKLPRRDIDSVRKWIADGAYDPCANTPLPPGESRKSNGVTTKLWSLRPVLPVDVPDVDADPWIRNDIDRFILAKLRSDKLSPNDAADKFAILRRATFDLTGLPPTPDEIDARINDVSADAYQRLIDRLLDSPRYGERWGRHWLDLARYGDSNGGDINYAHANAWRYRDYVIKAFNDDKPYDTFIREQLAGDLLAYDGDVDRRRELLTATGFLMLGPKMLAEVDTDKLLIDIVDEQLDVTGLTFLGMTFGCARCHDHKFDPITIADYYALAGIFRSTKVIDVLRPSNGVSEWLEVDVTPAEALAMIKERNSDKQRLQQMLADLGEPTAAEGNKANAAGKAILATKLPSLRSTTWSAWVRIATPQNLGGVISATYDGADQGHSLGFDRGQTPRVVWNHGSGRHTIIAAAKPISYGQWHHVGLTFDAASEQLRLFVDGHVAATAANVATAEFHTIGVGRREASRQFQFIGDVDEVRVYDSALSEAQLQQLSNRREPNPANIEAERRKPSGPPRTMSPQMPGGLRRTAPMKKRSQDKVNDLGDEPAARPLLHWSFHEVRDDLVIDAAPGMFNGQFIGVSAEKAIIEDGATGAAFTFDNSREDAKPDAARNRQITELRKQIQELESATPSPTLVMAVAAAQPLDLPVHLRGSHLKLADTPTARGTPQVFETALDPVIVPPTENGRLQLADWIASPKNPLTARVMVNRIWQHHFGEGLVRTPSNFGTRGEQPSHPELLDWLAGEFVASGWSIKQMHRLIMNSATYRQSSRLNAAASKRDPGNRLLTRYPIRRLEAEAIRDSLLAVTGELDQTAGGTMFTSENKKRVTMSPVDPMYDSPRRSVYLPAVRVRGYEMFSIFDVSDSGQHVAARPRTMVAQQALFLMNNPLVIQRAKNLTQQVVKRPQPFDEQVDWLHRLLYGRPATSAETSTLAEFFALLTASDAADRRDDDAKSYAWQHIIHTMLCANEFIHIR